MPAPAPTPAPSPAPPPEGTATPSAPAPTAETPSSAASRPAAAPSAGAAAQAPAVASAAAPAGPRRTAPRVDASWAGNTPPPYPMRARRMGDQGEVLLDVRVGADGRVTDVRLKRSSGSELLDRTAIDTVRQWRFTPATVDGEPVAEWYRDWKWVFRLNG
ncbi:energy transducer TonB [Zeimonas sediminis]|uniref:energy transducer TonB n=1 Tax=Zeimonas sediminis TaxID=2944268 RepID=UPI002342FEBB|nr:energy transducer TonB [Zeimonas sediminis]